MQQPSNLPQQIRVTELRGLNERVSPSGLKPGEFSWLEGLYPSQTGLLSRVPGKTLLATAAGNPAIRSFCQTFNTNGDIVVQTQSGILAYTLDELFNRQTVPNLTPGTTPSSNDNEEAMSIAIMYQEESNGAVGGSISGVISGTDSASNTTTAYGRRLTTNPVNQSSTLVSFTASTNAGSGQPSTAGQWVLNPGTYRIRGWFTFSSSSSSSTGVQVELYNFTNSATQLDDGSAPIVGMAWNDTTGTTANLTAYLNGRFTVTGSNNTFNINQFGTPAGAGSIRGLSFCGRPSGVTATLVNAAAAKQRYATVEILKEP